MSKLGKHIYPQVFDVDNQIDYNYAIFPDSFTFGGPTGGSAAVAENFFFDYSSITNWNEVRDVLTASCTFVVDQIDLLYQTAGGLTSFPGLTSSEQEALSRNFLIPKAERDTVHTEEEQRIFSEELYLCNELKHRGDTIRNSTDYIVTSDNVEVQTFLDNPLNFTVPGSGGGGSVSSVNGQVGAVILGLNELDDVNTAGLTTDHVLTYNGANWVTELRPPLTIHTLSENYLNYNSSTGELFMEALAITDVTVNVTATSAAIWFGEEINASAHEEGDTIIFTNTPFDTEIYMHNGGSSIDFTDFTRIKSGAASEAFTRSLFSGVSPVEYDSLTGVISMTQSSTQSSGFLSQTDFNTFNDKVDSVNGEFGAVILSTTNITEGVNLYYTDVRARLSITGGTGINYNPITGVIEATGGVTSSVTSVNGQTGVVTLTLDDLGGIDNTGVTAGYILTYDGFTWSGATAVNSINGQTGNITLATDDISDVGQTNLYFTETLARDSISGGTGINYNNTTGLIQFDATNIAGDGLTTTDGYVIETLLILNSGLSFSSGAIDLNIGTGLTNLGGVIAVDINDSATNSTTELWSVDKIYNELLLVSGGTSGGVSSVNGQFGVVSLDTADIPENTNLYYTDTRARLSITASTGIVYDNSTGIIFADINDSATNSTSQLWSSDKIYSELQLVGGGGSSDVTSVNGQTGAVVLTLDDLGGIDNTGVTAGYILTYDGFTWSGATPSGGSATASLSDILTIGNTTLNGQTIDSFNGGGQLDLRAGSDNTVALTNDAGSQAEGGFYLSDNYSANFIDGWSSALELNKVTGGYAVDLYTTHGMITIDDGSGVFTPSLNGLHIYNSGSASKTMPAEGIKEINAFLASPSSSVNQNVKNSAALGGSSIKLKTNNMAYVNKLAFNVGGSFETVIDHTTATADRTATLQDKSGTIAYLSDVSSGAVTSVNGATGAVTLATDDISDAGQINAYFTNALARNAISGATGISYNTTTGVIEADINDSATNSTSQMWSTDKIYTELQLVSGGTAGGVTSVNSQTGVVTLDIDDLTDVDTTTATASVDDLLKWNGTNWVPTTPVVKKTWSWGASRNSANVTNSYLGQYGSTPTNQSPYVAFMNCKIKNMSVSTNSDETWIAEARINGVSSATMSIVGMSGTYSTFDVNVNAGDKISFYCNGSNIDRPNIQIIMEEI